VGKDSWIVVKGNYNLSNGLRQLHDQNIYFSSDASTPIQVNPWQKSQKLIVELGLRRNKAMEWTRYVQSLVNNSIKLG
jgi:hypothetical protein